MNKIMQVKGLTCVFNMPKEVKGKKDKNGQEISHDLPPYSPVDAYVVDEYPACPSNWMHGSGISSSYFLGVEEGHGMWLDFNSCFHHEYDVAVVLSIQGINPITGQKMIGKEVLRLERYVNKCPVHNVDFQQDRFCPECKFKWPGQNYISTTGTPFGRLWIDGFRTPDGKIRQYIITEDEKRGVAAQLIGEDRVFAIGVAYYLSKKKKPEPQKPDPSAAGLCSPFIGMVQTFSPMHTPSSWNNKRSSGQSTDLYGGTLCSTNNANNSSAHSFADKNVMSFLPNEDEMQVDSFCFGEAADLGAVEIQSIPEITPVKNLEIGAGALISQNIYDDPESIDFWRSEPTGMIYINYCDKQTLKKILTAGKRKDEKDGFMQGLKVGSE